MNDSVINKDILLRLTAIDQQMDGADNELLERLRAECEKLEEYVYLSSEQFVIFEKDGLFGLKLNAVEGVVEEKELYPPIFDSIESLGGEFDACLVGRKGRSMTILYQDSVRIDKTIECDEIVPTNMNYWYMIRAKEKWGLYSIMENDWILPIEYDELEQKYDHIVTKKDGKFGLVLGRHIVVEAKYDGIRFCRNSGFVGFYKGKELGYIDTDGEWTKDITKASVWTELCELV